MAFKAGAIYGEASLDTKKWHEPLRGLHASTKIAMAAASAAVVAFAVKAVKSADEFQRSMSNVSTVVDTSRVSMQKLATEVLRLDPQLGQTKELTDALYETFSAGAQTAKEAMETTVTAAKFGRAALTSTNNAVNALTTAVNAYGRENMSASKASDIFFQTVKIGKLTGDQLASTIGDSIPLFSSAGIRLEELGASMAAITQQGVNASEATTQLNGIVNAFLSPSEALAKRIKQVGFESGAAFIRAKGLTGALELLESTTKGDAGAMAELIPNIRGMRGAMALTGQGGEIFKDSLLAMADAAGSTEEAFAKQEKTFATLQASMKTAEIIVGNIGKHFVDEVATGATQSTQAMINFVTSAEGMNAVAEISGIVAAGFSVIRDVWETLSGAIRPALTEVWDKIKDRFSDVSSGSEAAAVGSKVLSVALNLVTSSIAVAVKIIKTQIDWYADWIRAIRETSGVVGQFWKFLKGEATWEDVKKQAGSAGEAFKSIGVNFVENVGDVFKTVRDEVREFSGETEELSARISGNAEVAFTSASSHVRANWNEIITGQRDTMSEIEKNALRIPKATRNATEETRKSLERFFDNSETRWEDYFDTIEGGLSTQYAGLASISDMFFDNERDRVELDKQHRLDALEERFKQGLITEEQYEEQKATLEADALKRENDLAKKAFESAKKFQIGQVWMDTASAIVGWWRAAAKLGPILGPIFGGVMSAASTALAVAQTSLIAKQSFVPSRAEGGVASGLTRINERGGEIVTLPDNSQVIPADISRQIAVASGGGVEINVSFEGAVISDSVSLDKVVDQVVRRLGRQMRLSAA